MYIFLGPSEIGPILNMSNNTKDSNLQQFHYVLINQCIFLNVWFGLTKLYLKTKFQLMETLKDNFCKKYFSLFDIKMKTFYLPKNFIIITTKHMYTFKILKEMLSGVYILQESHHGEVAIKIATYEGVFLTF